jgi:photosystem II stability/assembly factor-like uncharacterized protein
MKRLLIIFIASFSLCISQSISQTYGWKNISSNVPNLPNDTVIIGTDTMVAMIRAAHFLDDAEGWIIITTTIDSSYILHTENGGNSWDHRSTHKTPFNDIHMLDQNTGFTGGQDGGIIYKTTDGGYTWNFHWTLGTILSEIEFPPAPADTGFACGMNGTLMMITPTGGAIMDVNVNSDLHGLSFPVNSREGWLSGWNIVRHFMDGSWYADQVHITGYHNCIEFIDNQTGWTCGDRIMHTWDGYNWIDQVTEDQLEGDMFSISFCNAAIGCAVGTVGQVFFTTDGGNNWNKVDLGTTEYLIDVQMTSPTCGYITGQGKLIYKYTEVNGEEEYENAKAWSIKAWPNPTSGQFRIQCSEFGNEVVKIELIDLFGKVNSILYEGKPDSKGIEFDVSHLPSGIYFCRIYSSGLSATKKIIIQKK